MPSLTAASSDATARASRAGACLPIAISQPKETARTRRGVRTGVLLAARTLRPTGSTLRGYLLVLLVARGARLSSAAKWWRWVLHVDPHIYPRA